MSYALKHILHNTEKFYDSLAIYVNTDGSIYQDEVEEVAEAQPQSQASGSKSGDSVEEEERDAEASREERDSFFV